jgi:Mg-chelatase subunit ChlD
MTSLVRCAVLCLLVAAGCVYKVQIRGYASKKPSNVALYVQIDNRFGRPIENLNSSKFRIYEDGKPVTTQESRQVILNPQAGAVHYTMLLLDLSGSMAKSEQLKTLESAASAFLTQISEIQRVGVYAFDGSSSIKVIVPFTSNPNELKQGISDILKFRPTDLSTNLYGAVIDALNTLKEYRDKPGNPKLSFATLVVFTDGSDLANRVTKTELKAALETSAEEGDKYIRIFSVGLGNKTDNRALRMIGRDGHFSSGKEQNLKDKFNTVADRIDGYSHRYYLLSYCSPARAGTHKLKVVVSNGSLGLRRGRVVYEFDATGFTPSCNPNDFPDLQRVEDKKKKEPKERKSRKERKEEKEKKESD